MLWSAVPVRQFSREQVRHAESRLTSANMGACAFAQTLTKVRIALSPPDSLGCGDIWRLRGANREKWPQFCNPSLPNRTGESLLSALLAGYAGFLSEAYRNSPAFNCSGRRMQGDHKPMKRRCRLDFVTTEASRGKLHIRAQSSRSA
jgi:hypothetical protein